MFLVGVFWAHPWRPHHDTSTIFSPTKVNGSWYGSVPKISAHPAIFASIAKFIEVNKVQLAFYTVCLHRFPCWIKTAMKEKPADNAVGLHGLKVGKEWERFLVPKMRMNCMLKHVKTPPCHSGEPVWTYKRFKIHFECPALKEDKGWH